MIAWRVVPALLLTIALARPAIGQSTDTTVAVANGARLRVEIPAGRIDVRVWDRNAVQVHATHDAATAVRIESSAALFTIGLSRSRGIAESECTITVPRWMAMTLGGGDVEIIVAGSAAEVVARNYSGKLVIQGGREKVVGESTLGEVTIAGVRGRVSAKSLHAPIRVSDVEGDVEVEGSSSHIYLSGIVSRNVTASTVGGVIWFNGPFRDDGHYSFTTHMGSIIMTVDQPVNAKVAVSTVSGAFSSPLPHTRQEGSRRGRFSVTFGTATANVEVQSFAGGIVIKAPEPKSKLE